jgi:HEAT repeat protein
VIAALLPLLQDASWGVRWNVVLALGMLGDEQVIEPLTQALADEYEPLRAVAMSVIESIRARQIP